MKDKLNSCYPDLWLLWLSQDNILNFIYPSKSEGIISVEAALTIDSTMTARGYLQSKEISLRISCIYDVRQIETLPTELVDTIACSSTEKLQPKDMIAEAITHIQNAVSDLTDHSRENLDDKSNDINLPLLQFQLCQLEIYVFPRIGEDIILSLKLSRLRLTSFLQHVIISYSL